MDSFNFSKLKEYIPKDLPNVQLPRMPTWTTPDPEDEDEALGEDTEDGPGEGQASHDEGLIVMTEPKPIAPGPKTNLDLINECDNFPYYFNDRRLFLAHVNTYYGLYVKDYPDVELGYVLPSVAEVLRGHPDWHMNDDDRSLTLITGSSEPERTEAIVRTTQAMRGTKHFKVLEGWRNEVYPIYGRNSELLFSMERSASPLFGIVTYGCHLTAYTTKKGENGGMRVWVPKRAATKQTYGGYLDNTVAGGIPTGESPFECLVREAQEEASLPEDVVRKGVKPTGTVTYFHIRDHRAGGETKLLQPECQYVYDLELEEDVVPKPSDDEVAEFELKTVDEVKDALKNGQFKPNCALVLLDFFVRHGILTADDEGYIEIVARLHRRLEFPTL